MRCNTRLRKDMRRSRVLKQSAKSLSLSPPIGRNPLSLGAERSQQSKHCRPLKVVEHAFVRAYFTQCCETAPGLAGESPPPPRIQSREGLFVYDRRTRIDPFDSVYVMAGEII